MIRSKCTRCRMPCGKERKYCFTCFKIVMDDMKKDGYLQYIPSHSFQRTPEAKEDTFDTKFGTDR